MRALSVGIFTEVYHPIRNGVVASLDALAVALAARECAVTVVTPQMPRYKDAAANVVRLPSLPLPTPTSYRLTLPVFARTDRERTRDFAIVHAHSPFVTGALALALARRRRIPLVFTYHTQLEAYAHYVPFEPRLVRRAAAALTQRFANAADAVIVPTPTMLRRLRALGVTTPIAVVPSGIDVAAFAASARGAAIRARYAIPRDARVVAFVGRLGREKNIESVIDAFARMNDETARLLLVGDGPHRARLERRAREAGVAARTTFTGELPRESLPDVYSAADVFAFASRSETQGLVLVEALAAGVPVVALDTPQTRDVLEDAGELVGEGTQALAMGLARVLASDPDSPSARERARAARRVASAFDRVALGGRVYDLYARVLGTAGATALPESDAAFAGVN